MSQENDVLHVREKSVIKIEADQEGYSDKPNKEKWLTIEFPNGLIYQLTKDGLLEALDDFVTKEVRLRGAGIVAECGFASVSFNKVS